jgi:hemerythrin
MEAGEERTRMWASIGGEQVLHVTADLALEDEHRHIIELLEELHHQIVHVAPIPAQRFTLHMMGIYLRVNCLAEKVMMDECAFPLRVKHEEEHRSHFGAIYAIDEEILAAKREDAITAVNAVRRMITTHIRDKDQELTEWMCAYQARGLLRSA